MVLEAEVREKVLLGAVSIQLLFAGFSPFYLGILSERLGSLRKFFFLCLLAASCFLSAGVFRLLVFLSFHCWWGSESWVSLDSSIGSVWELFWLFLL